MPKKLGKRSDQRMALLKNQVSELLWYGQIETTVDRAKSVKAIAEKLVTIAINSYQDVVKVKKQVKNAKGEVVNEGGNMKPVPVLLVTKLMDYPILRNLLLYNPCGKKTIGWIVMWLLPLTLPLYLIGNWEQKQLRHELQVIAHTNGEIKNIARQLIDEREKEIEK